MIKLIKRGLLSVGSVVGGGSVWGGISGDIADQTDLQTEIDSKIPLSGTTFGNPITGSLQIDSSSDKSIYQNIDILGTPFTTSLGYSDTFDLIAMTSDDGVAQTGIGINGYDILAVGGAAFKGIQYDADYSANFTNFSLINKGYADTTYSLDTDVVHISGIETITGLKTFSALLEAVNITVSNNLDTVLRRTYDSASRLSIDWENRDLWDNQVAPVLSIDWESRSLFGSSGTLSLDWENKEVIGTWKYLDGNESSGKLLISDASGNANWQTQPLIGISSGGTGQITAILAFNSLSPLTTLGDLLYHNGTNNVRLPGNSTSGLQFLGQTGTGLVSAAPSWQTLPTAGLATYFFYSSVASDIATYFVEQVTASVGVLDSQSFAGLSDGTTTLENFATLVGFPNITFLPPGVVTFYITARQSAGTKTSQLFGELYKRTSGGVETLVSTSAITTDLTSLDAAYIFQGAIPTGVVFLGTDRLVARIRTIVSGGGSAPTVVLSTEGDTAARCDIPAATVDANNFVPYNGAINNIDLNAKTITNVLTFNTLTVGLGAGSISTNTVLGASALSSNTTGANSVAIGYHALDANTTGGNNVAIGTDALGANTDGTKNVAIGPNTLKTNTSTINSIAIGYGALALDAGNNGQVAIGVDALSSNTTGTVNTAVGWQVLAANNSDANTGVGYRVLYQNTSGTYNSGLGLHALRDNTTGSYNTAMGGQSLQTNDFGDENTAMGYAALANQSGAAADQNVAVGSQAGLNNSIGNNGTFIGFQSGINNTTGKYNVYIGSNSGAGVETGNYNTIIGSQISGLSSTLSNNIILADGQGSIRLQFASTGVGTITNAFVQTNGVNNRATENKLLKVDTTDATTTELTTDGAAGSGATNRISVPVDTTLSVVVNISVKQQGSANSKQMLRQFVITNNGGTTAIEGTVIALGTDSGSAGLATVTTTITANDTDDCIKIEVTGLAATNLRYSAYIVSTEVKYT